MENKKSKQRYQNNRYIKVWAYVKCAMNLLGGKCPCGEDHVAALSFHHLKNKESLVSLMFRRTNDWEKIKKEVMKCELICENCHRKRHFDQERYDENYESICEMMKDVENGKCVRIKRWTEKDTETLKELYVAGLSIDKIAIEMRREASTIRRRIQTLCLPRRDKSTRKRPVAITQDVRGRIVTLCDGGASVLEIGKETGVSLRVIRRVMAEVKR